MSGSSQICIATYDHPCTLNTEMPRPPRRRGLGQLSPTKVAPSAEVDGAAPFVEPATWTPVTGVPNRLPKLLAIEHRWIPLATPQPLHRQASAPEREHRGPYDAVQRKRVVYDYDDRVSQFRRLIPRDNLFFDSHFECGNLLRAERLYPDRSVSIDHEAPSRASPEPPAAESSTSGPLRSGRETARAVERATKNVLGPRAASSATLASTATVDDMFMDLAAERMAASVEQSEASAAAARADAAAASGAAAAMATARVATPSESKVYIMQEYNLSLSYDVHTEGNCQWFYLSVANMSSGSQGRAYKFNFCGMSKPDSEFNRGMQPFLYSTRAAHLAAPGAAGAAGAAPSTAPATLPKFRAEGHQAGSGAPWDADSADGGAGAPGAPLRFGLNTQLPGPVGWIRDGFDIYYYEVRSVRHTL